MARFVSSVRARNPKKNRKDDPEGSTKQTFLDGANNENSCRSIRKGDHTSDSQNFLAARSRRGICLTEPGARLTRRDQRLCWINVQRGRDRGPEHGYRHPGGQGQSHEHVLLGGLNAKLSEASDLDADAKLEPSEQVECPHGDPVVTVFHRVQELVLAAPRVDSQPRTRLIPPNV